MGITKNNESDQRREYKSDHKRHSRNAARDIKAELDELVNKVDRRKRSALERNTEKWLKTMWPDDFEFAFTQDQKFRMKQTEDRMRTGGKVAIASPRGDGKTMLTEGLAIKNIAQVVIRGLVLLKANTEDGAAMMENIYEKILHENFLAWYPEIAFPFVDLGNIKQRAVSQHYDGKLTRLIVKKDLIVFPRATGAKCAESFIKSYGMNKAIRGYRRGALRPDFFIVDDPETEESAVSEVEIKKRSKILDRGLAKLGGQKKRISGVMLTTIQAKDSVSDKYTDIKQKPGWGGIRQKQIIRWPKNADLWDEYVDLRQECQRQGDKDGTKATVFYRKNRKKMDAGVKVSNPNVYDRGGEISAIQCCYNFIADHGMDAFMTECQNEPPEEIIEEGFDLTASTIQKRCEGTKHCIIPDGYGYLTAGMDVGGRMLHWEVTAWKDEFVGHVVDYGIQPVHGPRGSLTADENQEELEEAIRLAILAWSDDIKGRYKYRSGQERDIDCVAIDARYQTEAIYNAIRDAQTKGCIPVMGYGTTNKKAFRRPKQASDTIKVGAGWYKTFHDYKKLKVWQYHVDDDYYKFKVQQGFVLDAGMPGSLTLYGDNPFDHKTFARAIVSERRVEEFIPGKGRVEMYVVKDRNQNHFLDALKYSRMAAAVIGVIPKKRVEKQQTTNRQLRKPNRVNIRTSY